MSLYLWLVPAVISNLFAVYFLKTAEGMTRPWQSFGMVVSILLTQWLLAQMVRGGVDISLAITMIVVSVMVGSVVMGVLLFQESLPPLKIAGLFLAVTGVAMASMAKGAN